MHAVFALVYVEYAVGVLELKLDSRRILARMVVSEVLTRQAIDLWWEGGLCIQFCEGVVWGVSIAIWLRSI